MCGPDAGIQVAARYEDAIVMHHGRWVFARLRVHFDLMGAPG